MHQLLASLDPSWHAFIQSQIRLPYFQSLLSHIEAAQACGKRVYPPKSHWFRAFELTALEAVKVVVLGQDPYMRPGQAMGLSFSVPAGVSIPPSLRNIFKELEQDMQLRPTTDGDLTAWAEQGVFLLNAALTVEEGQPGSHLKQGWQTFTSRVIDHINQQRQHVVFLAWGAFAHRACQCVCPSKHHLIQTSHPSPLAARKASAMIPAFLGSGCFRQTNAYLAKNGQEPIHWQLEAQPFNLIIQANEAFYDHQK
jgi:uracil-DNA glycosylase